MSRPNRLDELKRVAQIYENNCKLGIGYTVKHYLAEGMQRLTIYKFWKALRWWSAGQKTGKWKKNNEK